ncbi:MAG: MoaD/ThiS family protein [Candidatus Desantisbacteria bacterium]
MAVKVLIPTPLQKLTGGRMEVELKSSSMNICGLLDELEAQYPGIKERLCDENGKVRRFINIYVNGEDIRFQQGEQTEVPEEGEVSIVPAIAGG